MRLFFPIAKVDAEQRMVYGYASTAAKDDQGETVALPALNAALADYMKFANIREMHQLSAVGTAKEAGVDDKGLYVAAHVVDDPAWEKVKAGVYKGFSIGGRVTERNPSDSSNITGLKLAEISLVDRPANPEAVFDCWKASGAEGGPEDDGAPADPAVPETPPAPSVDEHITAMTKVFADFEAMLDGLTKGGDEPGNGKKPYGDVEYADNGLQSDGKKRYPIDTKEHVRAAWSYINKPKNAGKYSAEDLASIKAKIKAAAKKFDIEISDDGKKAAEALLRKSLNDAGRVAHIAQDLKWVRDCVAMEAAMENDESSQPAKLLPVIAALVEWCQAELAEALEEIRDGTERDGTLVVTLAAVADGLAKGADITAPLDALKKAAAGEDGPADTHSTTNTAGNAEHAAPQATPPAGPANLEANATVDTEHGTHAQAIHDAAVAMGAKCSGAVAMAAPAGDLAKALAERDALSKAVAEMPERLAALAKRVEEIAATPLPPQTIARPAGLSSVSKVQDGGGADVAAPDEIARAWAAMSNEDQTLALIKGARRAALNRPGITDGPAPGDPRALR